MYFKLDGKWRRDDGPVVIWGDGDEWYYLNDTEYSKEEYYKALKD